MEPLVRDAAPGMNGNSSEVGKLVRAQLRAVVALITFTLIADSKHTA